MDWGSSPVDEGSMNEWLGFILLHTLKITWWLRKEEKWNCQGSLEIDTFLVRGGGGGYRCSFQIICLNVHYICPTPSSFFFFSCSFFFFLFFFFLLFLLFLAGNLGHLTCVTLPILCELMQDRTWAICTQLKLFQQFSFIFTSTDENPDVSQV